MPPRSRTEVRPKNHLASWPLIGAVVAAFARCFGYIAGWLAPGRLTPQRLANQLQNNSGVFAGYRRNHATGKPDPSRLASFFAAHPETTQEPRSNTKRACSRIACCTLLGIGVALSTEGRAADNDGWYTPDQAAHGHITFNSYCAECHRPDLKGALGPALIGDAFLQAWLNKPVRDLFHFEHSKMPANNPGSVPDDKIWNITAYILQKNGFPAGATPLGAQAASRPLAKPQ
jgi:S-disulfanyl-L-cysteine oxidoreductase SoxD